MISNLNDQSGQPSDYVQDETINPTGTTRHQIANAATIENTEDVFDI